MSRSFYRIANHAIAELRRRPSVQNFCKMHEHADRPLALLPVAERIASVLGLTDGRWSLELVFLDGRLVEAWPQLRPNKFTRSQLDLLDIPRD